MGNSVTLVGPDRASGRATGPEAAEAAELEGTVSGDKTPVRRGIANSVGPWGDPAVVAPVVVSGPSVDAAPLAKKDTHGVPVSGDLPSPAVPGGAKPSAGAIAMLRELGTNVGNLRGDGADLKAIWDEGAQKILKEDADRQGSGRAGQGRSLEQDETSALLKTPQERAALAALRQAGLSDLNLGTDNELKAAKVIAALPEEQRGQSSRALIQSAERGRLLEPSAANGKSLLDMLVIASEAKSTVLGAPSKTNLIRDLIDLGADKKVLVQGYDFATCGVSILGRCTLSVPPAEFARMAVELALTGESTMRSGRKITFDDGLKSGTPYKDQSVRPSVLMVNSALQNLVWNGNYDSRTDTATGPYQPTGHAVVYDGAHQGILPDQYQRLKGEATLQKHNQRNRFDESGEAILQAARDALPSPSQPLRLDLNNPASIKQLEDAPGIDGFMYWDPSGGDHLQHAVVIKPGPVIYNGVECIALEQTQVLSGSADPEKFPNKPGVELPNGMVLVPVSEMKDLVTFVFIPETGPDAGNYRHVDKLPDIFSKQPMVESSTPTTRIEPAWGDSGGVTVVTGGTYQYSPTGSNGGNGIANPTTRGPDQPITTRALVAEILAQKEGSHHKEEASARPIEGEEAHASLQRHRAGPRRGIDDETDEPQIVRKSDAQRSGESPEEERNPLRNGVLNQFGRNS